MLDAPNLTDHNPIETEQQQPNSKTKLHLIVCLPQVAFFMPIPVPIVFVILFIRPICTGSINIYISSEPQSS